MLGRGEDADEQDRIGYLVLEAMVSNAEGRYQQALEAALPSLDARLDATSKLGWEEALVAAHALGRTDVVRDIVSRIEHDGARPRCRPPCGRTGSGSGRCSATSRTSGSCRPAARIP